MPSDTPDRDLVPDALGHGRDAGVEQVAVLAQVSAIAPVLRETPTGWLAASAPGSAIPVGAVGVTRGQAEETFAAEIRAWPALAAKPDRPALES